VTIRARYGLDRVLLDAPGLIRLDLDFLSNGWVGDFSSPQLMSVRAAATHSDWTPQGFALKLTDQLNVCQSS
jgi:hypothetical protein